MSIILRITKQFLCINTYLKFENICVDELLMKKLVELFNLLNPNESEEKILEHLNYLENVENRKVQARLTLKRLRQKKISTSMKIKTLKIVITILRKKSF